MRLSCRSAKVVQGAWEGRLGANRTQDDSGILARSPSVLADDEAESDAGGHAPCFENHDWEESSYDNHSVTGGQGKEETKDDLISDKLRAILDDDPGI